MKKTLVIGVVGRKKSGKTTVVEYLIRKLVKEGYSVSAAKHVNQDDFSMDVRGKDTWRHAEAGANPVISVSNLETAVLMKDGISKFSASELVKLTPETDVTVLEGFSRIILQNEQIAKIVCVRDEKEYQMFEKTTEGEIIAFCSFQSVAGNVLNIQEDSKTLARLTLEYVKREMEILEILRKLPSLDCGKCGYSSCYDMATAIHQESTKMEECVPLNLKSKLKTKIVVGKVDVPIQPFVSRILRNTFLGMVSSLKGVSIEGDENIQIKISKEPL